MQSTFEDSAADELLLGKFVNEVGRKVPHWGDRSTIVGATPLTDITKDLIECAKVEYGLDISEKNANVFGKFESNALSGSVKVRPAVHIVEHAIKTGKLRRNQPLFEATSGNFGLSLGFLGKKLGLKAIVLVSRKLQKGVLDQLASEGVDAIDLDIDVCPAPGLKMDPGTLAARAVASRIRDKLCEFGCFDMKAFDNSRAEIEDLLAKQDAIGLARFLALIFGGFCPEQYDNELNVKAHQTITGPEIDQQLHALGNSLGDYDVVCTFGTGGTSGGLSRYVKDVYGTKSVRVIFPLLNQDVAGIRSKQKASGLRFFEPERYLGIHEVDFTAAKKLLRFFVTKKGYDIGESSALALFAVMQMINYGAGTRFIAILGDGIHKYRQSLDKERAREEEKDLEVTFQEASSDIANYSQVLWTHGTYVPTAEGIRLISSALGCVAHQIKVANPKDVEQVIDDKYDDGELPYGLKELLPSRLENDHDRSGEKKRKLLVMCMSGKTSLAVVQSLANKGVQAVSLTGGITGLSTNEGVQISRLVQAREAEGKS